MSSGKVHRKASILLSSSFLIPIVFTWDFSYLLCAVGALMGVVFTPDWDVDAGFIVDNDIRKFFGKWFEEKIWDKFLYWYRRSLKHGSPLSHVPIISTFGRIAYVFIFFIIVPHAVAYLLLKPSWDFYQVISWYWSKILNQREILYGLIGSDIIHWFLDILTTEHSEKKRS